MNRAVILCSISWLFYSWAFALVPVSLSGPSPAIASVYSANTSTTLIYTIKNNVPKSLPLSISGISHEIQRTTVAGDCGNALPVGPSTCNVGLTISPSNEQIGASTSQTVQFNYQGRTALTSTISFSVSGSYAYVTPTLDATVIDQFLLGRDGLLSSYNPAYTAIGSEAFGQMTFAMVNGVQYAYILDPQGAVYWCSINTDGSLNNCATTAALPPLNTWLARGIAFATFNAQYAYILDPSNYYVYQCALDTAGNFSNCATLSSLPFSAAYGIAFTSDSFGVQHAYVTDAGSGGAVWVCSMQNDGAFNICAKTPTSGAPPNWVPYAVAFTRVNGTPYAYVADNGSGPPGHVYRCALNNNGTFVNSGCTQTPSNESSLTNWYPYYIAFHTIGGTQYAYIVNSSGSSIGNIYRCVLDNSGELTDCVFTPDILPSSWQPSGIAFR